MSELRQDRARLTAWYVPADMGYDLTLVKADFTIPKANEERAFAAALKLHEDVIIGGRKPADLGAVFADLAWPLKPTEAGWKMVGGPKVKRGWERDLFERVAPYVADGSFIHARGEDGAPFFHIFAHGELLSEEVEVEIGEIEFAIPEELAEEALEAARTVVPDTEEDEEITGLDALFDWMGWTSEVDEDGAITVVEKVSEGLGYEDAVFSLIAPFVAPGSSIEGSGESGDWRWVFKNKKCRRVYE